MKLCVVPFSAALQLLLIVASPAATATVTNTNDNLAGSLRQAVQGATAGDTIMFNIPTTDLNYTPATRSWTTD
jgi:hypothetical protein